MELIENVKISALYVYEGLKRVETEEAMLGDIVVVAGIADVNIGETIADASRSRSTSFCRY